jgi:hypothetical protein
MLVSRATSARAHSFVTRSRAMASLRSSGSSFQTSISCAIVPDPLAGIDEPIDVRSFMSVVSDTRHPSPGLPSSSSFGIRVSVK